MRAEQDRKKSIFYRFPDVDYVEYVYFPDETDASRQLDILEGVKRFIKTKDFANLPAPDNTHTSGKAQYSLRELDAPYLDAVERGDMETAQRMVLEAAKRAGYLSDTSYQGSLAFNGAAPVENDYFETKVQRKEAWDNGDYEGTMSLGDYADSSIDTHDLKWQLTDRGNYRRAENYTKESIDNINNALKSDNHKITIYRAVPNNVEEGAVRNGDWVTPSRRYAEYHIGLQDWEGGRIIEQEVDIDHLWWNGDDINEWGYDDGSNYGYRNTPNNRKLLDPVTYDDNGNVIPLSERFNPNKEDIRFSLMRPTNEEVTFDNFFDNTSAVFTLLPKSEAPQREADYESKRWDGFGVSSRYWYGEDEQGKYVVRASDHWSSYPRGANSRKAFEDNPYHRIYTQIASCRWALDMADAPDVATPRPEPRASQEEWDAYNKARKAQKAAFEDTYIDGKTMYGKAYLDDFTKWKAEPRYSFQDLPFFVDDEGDVFYFNDDTEVTDRPRNVQLLHYNLGELVPRSGVSW